MKGSKGTEALWKEANHRRWQWGLSVYQGGPSVQPRVSLNEAWNAGFITCLELVDDYSVADAVLSLKNYAADLEELLRRVVKHAESMDPLRQLQHAEDLAEARAFLEEK